MANIVFNIAKGRIVELYNRVKGNDPANAALILVPIETSGLESDATLVDKDDLAAVLTYIRRAWGNTGTPVDRALVEGARAETAKRTRPWTNDELSALTGGPP